MAGPSGEVFEDFVNEPGAAAAVHADDIRAHSPKLGERGDGFRTSVAPGPLQERHLRDDRKIANRARRVVCDLEALVPSEGLQDQQVGARVGQRRGLLFEDRRLVRRLELQRVFPGDRPDGPRDEDLTRAGGIARDGHADGVDFRHLVFEAVRGEPGAVRAERVRLDDLRAGRDVTRVDLPDRLGPPQVQGIERLVEGDAHVVEHGAHRAIADEGGFAQSVEKLHRKCAVSQLIRPCSSRVVATAAFEGDRDECLGGRAEQLSVTPNQVELARNGKSVEGNLHQRAVPDLGAYREIGEERHAESFDHSGLHGLGAAHLAGDLECRARVASVIGCGQCGFGRGTCAGPSFAHDERLIGDVRQCHAALGRQGVTGRGDENESIAVDLIAVQIAACRQTTHHRGFDLACGDAVEDLVRVAGLHPNRNGRVASMELGDQTGEQIARRNRRGTQHQRAGKQTGEIGNRLSRVPLGSEGLTSGPKKRVTRRGRFGAAAITFDQANAQAPLEFGDVAAHRRLREVQGTRSFGERTAIDQSDKRLELPNRKRIAGHVISQNMVAPHPNRGMAAIVRTCSPTLRRSLAGVSG